MTVFNDREVFTVQPDYVGPPSVSYVWPVEQIDYERGRTAQFRPIEWMARGIEAEFNGLNLEDATEVEDFFDRMKGRRTAFYMPTWEQDLDLVETAGSGTSSFLAEGRYLADDFGTADFDDTWAVAVCLTSGEQIYRLVTGIAVETANSRVSISGTWGVDITAANLARISWLPLLRFASDEMTTSWRTPLAAYIRLSFQQVSA